MRGGTLILSREKELYPYFRKRLKELGFSNFDVTGEERDSLNAIISEMNPGLILAGSGFYRCSTPYMMGQLLKLYPRLNSAAVSVFCKIPDDLAMWFIINGVKSYVNFFEGLDEFYKGLNRVRQGGEYISPGVMKRIEMRKEMPERAGNLTARHIEVVRLLSNGFTSFEIADALHISKRTLDTYKTDLYTRLNVRNENELIRAAHYLGYINPEELIFFGGRYALNPKPEKQRKPTAKSASMRIL
jgi:DNA-binding NarL/FixJ family response regulator